MFAPQSGDSIEISAYYYRKDNEQWAANARLAKLARAGRPGLLSRALCSLASLFAGRRTSEASAALPASPRATAPVAMLRPRVATAESEDDLLEGRQGTAAA